MVVNGPEARDDSNRLFSEPLPTGAGPGTSDGIPVPSADQLKALLQLKESSPDECLRLIESARSASSENTDVRAESESEESEETTMETSSDTGSIVREVNRQLEESTSESEDGNSGIVSDEGTSIKTVLDNSEWQTRKSKRSRRNSNASSESEASEQASNTKKKGRVDENSNPGHLVFIKGSGFDIAKEASRQPIQFSRTLSCAVGRVTEVKLLKDCVRVTCTSPKQKIVLLQMTEWNGKTISVTEPWSKSGRNGADKSRSGARLVRGIIFGVSTELTDADIVSETGGLAARRLTRRIEGENKPTGNVVISFPETLPSNVCIGYLRYKAKSYIPQPMRCQKCQGYGHIAANCRRQVKCVRCGQGHSWESCPVKDDVTQAVCVNCKGRHSAAYKGCSKYQEVSKVLKVAAVDQVSYRDALMKVRSGDVLQRPVGGETTAAAAAGGVAGPTTSTPITTAVPSTSSRVRKPSQPSAKRELFQRTSTATTARGAPPPEPARDNQPTPAARPTADFSEDRRSYISFKGYCQQLTYYFLYTLDILRGKTKQYDLNYVAYSINELASIIFGSHGDDACLTPDCPKPKD